ncbi:CgeB family protein [Streptomyces sp. NPDC002078]
MLQCDDHVLHTARRTQGHAVLLALADDYGDQAAGPSFECETFLPVLRQFFGKVTLWPLDRLLRQRGYFRMNADLESWVRRESPDLVFCVPFENQIDWPRLGALRGSGTATMAWMCDDHWRFDNFSRLIAPNFDFVATTDRAAYLRYHTLPGVRPLLTQWGCDTRRFRPAEGTWAHEVSFVGSRHPHRARHIDALRRAGVRVFVRGRGWPEGRATTEELATIPAQSLVSLNFANSSGSLKQLKARPFELTGTGTCVVSEYDPQLSSYFEVGEELVAFRSPSECVRVVKSLLRDPARARRIGESGRSRTEREHTYEARIGRLLAAAGFEGTPRNTDGHTCIMN